MKELITRGYVIVEQEKLNNCLYIIFSGKVDITFELRRGLKVKIGTLRKGSVFGYDSGLD